VAVGDHVGDLERIEEAHERVEVKGLEHEADDERAERNFAAELGHDEDGVDVAGMVGEDEGRALERAEFVEAVDVDAVTQSGERAANEAEEELSGSHESGGVLLAKVGCRG
jgi:hypothetical protein